MKAKSFVWYYIQQKKKTKVEFPSYREAARALSVSEHTIRYYQENDIHSEQDKKWKRKS